MNPTHADILRDLLVAEGHGERSLVHAARVFDIKRLDQLWYIVRSAAFRLDEENCSLCHAERRAHLSSCIIWDVLRGEFDTLAQLVERSELNRVHAYALRAVPESECFRCRRAEPCGSRRVRLVFAVSHFEPYLKPFTCDFELAPLCCWCTADFTHHMNEHVPAEPWAMRWDRAMDLLYTPPTEAVMRSRFVTRSDGGVGDHHHETWCWRRR